MPIDEDALMRAAGKLAVGKIREVVEATKAEMGERADGVTWQEPTSGSPEDYGRFGFTPPEIADEFLAKFKARLR